MAKTQTAPQAMTTVTEVVNAIAARKISPEDGARLISQLSQPPKGKKRIVKLNTSGGLFVTDPTFKAWSARLSKQYTAGVNLDINVARALFNNDELLKEIRQFLADQK